MTKWHADQFLPPQSRIIKIADTSEFKTMVMDDPFILPRSPDPEQTVFTPAHLWASYFESVMLSSPWDFFLCQAMLDARSAFSVAEFLPAIPLAVFSSTTESDDGQLFSTGTDFSSTLETGRTCLHKMDPSTLGRCESIEEAGLFPLFPAAVILAAGACLADH